MDTKVFVDTSAWLAYSSPKETGHLLIKSLFQEMFVSNCQIFTSNDIIDETLTRFNTQSGWHLAKQFLDYIQQSLTANAVTQLWINHQIQADAFNLLEKFKDHRLSLTDATSAILMKNLRISTILTLDHKHFTTMGFRVLPS